MEQHELGSFTWVELSDPSRAELGAVRDRFDLPIFALDVASRPHHRPRLERYEGSLLLVLKPATYVDPDEVVEIGQLALLVGSDVVVTIGCGHADLFRTVRHRLATDPAVLASGPAAVVHAVVEDLVDAYTSVLEGLDNDVDEIETQVFSPSRGSHAERIYRLKSEVQEFRRATATLGDELEALADGVPAPGFGALGDQFREVCVRATRVAEHVSHLDGLLNSALSAHQAQIGIQQNNDMRRISAWVAIVATPTAMAGIYGMNFRYMPELQWRYGYYVVLAVMASICVLLHRLFKRSGWL